MIRLVFKLLGTLCVTLMILLTQTSTTEGNNKTVWDGVYTIEQAKRGEQIYRQECTACHRDNLLGNTIDGGPPLRGPQFTMRWQGLNLEILIETIEELMPFDEPGTLSRQEYVDVTSFILWGNDIPAGSSELPTEPEALQQILMTTDSKPSQ